MNQILSILFPATMGTLIYLKNIKENTLQSILAYMINVLLTNISAYAYYYYIKDIKKFTFSNIFTIKYALISILISILIGIIMTIINKNIKLKIEVIKNEKRNKNKKNNKYNSKNNQ